MTTVDEKLTRVHNIFYPESVAIVGATKVPGTVPHDLVMNILRSGFQGGVYPVSPREKYIAGIKCHKYVLDIDDPVDLAVIVFPSSVCHLALEQCGKKGIKSVIIISAGFREIGSNGIEREEQLKTIAKKYGISFIGPNCLGVINTDPNVILDASFARQMPEEGNIAFLSQSGALCTAVLDYARAKHIGFSKFVSFGNKADVSEIDLLYYLGEDPKTHVILLYLEEISNGPGLMKAAEDIIAKTGKPILAIKSGRTEAGASAAASHTGSLAGSDDICDAALKQAGIIRCTTIEEMFNLAIALAYQPLPQNNRVAIITNAGGPGVLTTDASISEGLRLAKFSDATTTILKKSLPLTANIKNPVDIIGDARADRYKVAIAQALADDNVDGVFVILTPQSMTDIETIARAVCDVAGQHQKPVYTSFMGEADVSYGIDILQRNKLPHYILPESMSKAFAQAFSFRQQQKRKKNRPVSFKDVHKAKAQKVLKDAKSSGQNYLPEEEALEILELYNLPVLQRAMVSSAEEAAVAAGDIGFPVVMKIISKDIVHKFDVGGVVLNIQSKNEARQAYQKIMKNVNDNKPQAQIKGILVSKMISDGMEVILGIKRDVAFGPVIMFGIGGIFVEIFKDVTFRVAPLDRVTVQSMIEEVQAYELLKGARGQSAKDVDAIKDCLLRLSRLAVDCQNIKELDINPLIVRNAGEGAYIADAKIMI
ncbi:MAG: CoA-binding protein [Caldithrix sp.]|nr:CoA-binding protein [Caldithrix sp.]